MILIKIYVIFNFGFKKKSLKMYFSSGYVYAVLKYPENTGGLAKHLRWRTRSESAP